MTPPPIENPLQQTAVPPIVVGYNSRKVGRFNLRPNPRPNANPDFRIPDSFATEALRQTN